MKKVELEAIVRKNLIFAAGGEGPLVGEAFPRIIAAAEEYARGNAEAATKGTLFEGPMTATEIVRRNSEEPPELAARQAKFLLPLIQAIREPLLAALPKERA